MTLALALVTALPGEHRDPLLDSVGSAGPTSDLRDAAARQKLVRQRDTQYGRLSSRLRVNILREVGLWSCTEV